MRECERFETQKPKRALKRLFIGSAHLNAQCWGWCACSLKVSVSLSPDTSGSIPTWQYLCLIIFTFVLFLSKRPWSWTFQWIRVKLFFHINIWGCTNFFFLVQNTCFVFSLIMNMCSSLKILSYYFCHFTISAKTHDLIRTGTTMKFLISPSEL